MYCRKQILSDDKMYVYEAFSQTTQLSDVYNCLMMDVKHCQEDDVNALVFLLPHVYKEVIQLCRFFFIVTDIVLKMCILKGFDW